MAVITGMTAEQRAQRAQALARDDRFREALALVRAAPADQKARFADFEIGLLKASQSYDELIALREAQVKATPNSMVAYHNLASSLGDAGRHAEAEVAARKALSLGGNAPETWLVLGRSLQALGRAEESLAAYRGAIERRAGYVDAVNELAQQIWMSGGAVEQARQPFEQALAQFPTNTALLRALAVFNAYVGMAPDAVHDDLVRRAQQARVRDAGVEVAASHL
ncbi:tetratricopeptide repeat protein, partial [uncultured Brevundimonas sp.]|uniref:tetratricopeptide repeat protein n=1 Tax=uncultured Brevundimonas sp. TaxID=213418 RepID=UPI002614F953